MYQEYGVGKRFFIMSASRPVSPDWALRGNRHCKISNFFNTTIKTTHIQTKKFNEDNYNLCKIVTERRILALGDYNQI